MDFVILPVANPDGYAYTWHMGGNNDVSYCWIFWNKINNSWCKANLWAKHKSEIVVKYPSSRRASDSSFLSNKNKHEHFHTSHISLTPLRYVITLPGNTFAEKSQAQLAQIFFISWNFFYEYIVKWFFLQYSRLWPKNRRYLGFGCRGVDLNRNFGYAFARK